MVEIQSTIALSNKIRCSWNSMKFVMNAKITLIFVMMLALETSITCIGVLLLIIVYMISIYCQLFYLSVIGKNTSEGTFK